MEAIYYPNLVLTFSGPDAVKFSDSIQELGLPAIAGVTNRACVDSQFGKRSVGVASDCHDGFGPQRFQEPDQKRSAHLTFLARVAAVRHRVVRFVGMKWEYVPEKDRALETFQHRPYDFRGPLSDGRSFGRPYQGRSSEKMGVRRKVNLVSERKSGSPTTSITQIPRNPERVHAAFLCRRENSSEVAAANGGGICSVVATTRLCVGIKNFIEFQRSDPSDEVVYAPTFVRHSGEHPLIRWSKRATELCADFLKELYAENRRPRGEGSACKGAVPTGFGVNRVVCGRKLHDLRTMAEEGKMLGDSPKGCMIKVRGEAPIAREAVTCLQS